MNAHLFRSAAVPTISAIALFALAATACGRSPRPKPCEEMTSLEECQMAAHCVDTMDNVKDGWDGNAWHCESKKGPAK